MNSGIDAMPGLYGFNVTGGPPRTPAMTADLEDRLTCDVLQARTASIVFAAALRVGIGERGVVGGGGSGGADCDSSNSLFGSDGEDSDEGIDGVPMPLPTSISASLSVQVCAGGHSAEVGARGTPAAGSAPGTSRTAVQGQDLAATSNSARRPSSPEGLTAPIIETAAGSDDARATGGNKRVAKAVAILALGDQLMKKAASMIASARATATSKNPNPSEGFVPAARVPPSDGATASAAQGAEDDTTLSNRIDTQDGETGDATGGSSREPEQSGGDEDANGSGDAEICAGTNEKTKEDDKRECAKALEIKRAREQEERARARAAAKDRGLERGKRVAEKLQAERETQVEARREWPRTRQATLEEAIPLGRGKQGSGSRRRVSGAKGAICMVGAAEARRKRGVSRGRSWSVTRRTKSRRRSADYSTSTSSFDSESDSSSDSSRDGHRERRQGKRTGTRISRRCAWRAMSSSDEDGGGSNSSRIVRRSVSRKRSLSRTRSRSRSRSADVGTRHKRSARDGRDRTCRSPDRRHRRSSPSQECGKRPRWTSSRHSLSSSSDERRARGRSRSRERERGTRGSFRGDGGRAKQGRSRSPYSTERQRSRGERVSGGLGSPGSWQPSKRYVGLFDGAETRAGAGWRTSASSTDSQTLSEGNATVWQKDYGYHVTKRAREDGEIGMTQAAASKMAALQAFASNSSSKQSPTTEGAQEQDDVDEKEEGEIDTHQALALMTARDEQHVQQATPNVPEPSKKKPKAPGSPAAARGSANAQQGQQAPPAVPNAPKPRRKKPRRKKLKAPAVQTAAGAGPPGARLAATGAPGHVPPRAPGQGQSSLESLPRGAKKFVAKVKAKAKANAERAEYLALVNQTQVVQEVEDLAEESAARAEAAKVTAAILTARALSAPGASEGKINAAIRKAKAQAEKAEYRARIYQFRAARKAKGLVEMRAARAEAAKLTSAILTARALSASAASQDSAAAPAPGPPSTPVAPTPLR